jgi:hypothetical protein
MNAYYASAAKKEIIIPFWFQTLKSQRPPKKELPALPGEGYRCRARADFSQARRPRVLSYLSCPALKIS